MARRGGSRRTYVRDANGRFASTPGGGGGSKRPATKPVKRGPNRLTRDNAGRITSVGGDGATVRGGRLKTAAGNLRGRQVAKLKTMQGVSYGKAKPTALAGAATTLRQSLAKAKTAADEARARVAYKRVVRQELKSNPQSILAGNAPKKNRLPSQDSRMQKSKIRTAGNSKEQVQKRVERKLYQAKRALDRTLEARTKGLLVNDSIYQKQLKTSATLKQASKYAKTGEMPKGDNSIAAKRKMADAKERLSQKNMQRARERALGLPSLPNGTRKMVTKRARPPLTERIKASKARLVAKAEAVADELRKVNNAQNRDNSTSMTPRYLKLIERENKAQRRANSLRKAAKALKQIELTAAPEVYGFARGTAQRKKMADQIRQGRQRLRELKKAEAAASRSYQESPVVKYGLWGEIGQNRRQSRKAKARSSSRQTNIVDTYISARMNTRSQAASIQEMRRRAKEQTAATNAARKRKPKP